MTTMMYAHDGGELEVEFDFEAPDDEVGYSGGVSICEITANGMSIYYLLDGTKAMASIVDACLEHIESELKEAEYDRAEYIIQNRKDDRISQ